MRHQGLFLGLSCCLTVIVLTAGCSSETSSGGDTDVPTGSLSLQLDLAGGATIDEVWYRITGNQMPEMTGFIDTRAPGATASVEVFGLSAGLGYLVELRAIADDDTSCEGSAPFDVYAGQATSVGVMLNCKPPERFGSVRVNGKLNVCAYLDKVIVSPLQTSVGHTIDLFAHGTDADEDAVSYSWSASGGAISETSSPTTVYTCTIPGRYAIRVDVSDDSFADCIDSWTVEVQCVGDGGGTGGTAGAGGTGGTGGTAMECSPAQYRCQNGEIDPIEEDPACMLSEPPDLPNACTGSESLINPTSCSLTGTTSTHEVQRIAVARDCNAGFNLDRCDGESCNIGGLAPGEGLDGVDNALTGLAPVLNGVGGNLGGVDQALYEGLCDGTIDWAFEIDANLEESCATVTPIYGGLPAAPVLLNLSSTGCVSGTLGDMPLEIEGVPGVLGNATVRGTADGANGLEVQLGGTADAATAVAIAEALLEGAGAVVGQVFDINDDLDDDLQSACNALSLTFDVAAAAGGGSDTPSIEEIIQAVDPDRYEADLETLSVVRDRGSATWQAAQDLCAERLEAYGYEVERHAYGTGVNVIGKLPGEIDRQMIISAHYDAVPGCPGADDNASGVAGALEAARVLSAARYQQTLVVACWDEEELGLIGSRAYAVRERNRGTDVGAMFSFEMIGYSSEEPNSQLLPQGFDVLFPAQVAQVMENELRGDFIAMVGDIDSIGMIQAFGGYAQSLGLPWVELVLSDVFLFSPATGDLRRSDHAPFWEQGYPGIMTTDSANFRNLNYHCLGGLDTADRLNTDFSVKVIRSVVGATAELAEIVGGT